MDPKITKRPLSAFMFFMQDYRKNNKTSTSTIGETAKYAAVKWKSITDDDRKKFQDMANNDKKRYETDLASGMVVASKKFKKNVSKRGSKKLKDPNAPKKTKTAYMCFLGEYRKNSTLLGAKLISKAAEQWKLLKDDDKEKYVQMSLIDKQRYENELDKYKKSNQLAKPKVTKSSNAAQSGKQSNNTNSNVVAFTKNNVKSKKSQNSKANNDDDDEDDDDDEIDSDPSSDVNNDISTSDDTPISE